MFAMDYKPHPATLLALWIAVAVVVQLATLRWLAGALLLAAPLFLFNTGTRALTLIRRARWLLLSIILLFAFGTPGQRLDGVAGDIGLTWDGLQLGAEQVLRLLLLLASLAWLHDRLGSQGLVAGIHGLLGPVADWRGLRERLVVRLMLVLESVDAQADLSWRDWLSEPAVEPDGVLSLVSPPFGWPDRLLLAALILLASLAWAVA